MKYVFYHANCPDGFGARWAAEKRWAAAAQYIPLAYGEPIPALANPEKVYFVDFCPPRVFLDAVTYPITVLDHHKTAQKDLDGWKGEAIFDMERSGAGITWDYFHVAPRPALINYVEDRDLWRWKLPHSREVSAWMMSWPYEQDVWSSLANVLEHDFDNTVRVGEAILRAKHQTVKMQANQAKFKDIGGYVVPTVNATAYFSEVGEELCIQHPDHLFSAYYFDRADGKRHWGLRSRNGFDVSTVAKQFGGGGHQAAAGWVEG